MRSKAARARGQGESFSIRGRFRSITLSAACRTCWLLHISATSRATYTGASTRTQSATLFDGSMVKIRGLLPVWGLGVSDDVKSQSNGSDHSIRGLTRDRTVAASPYPDR